MNESAVSNAYSTESARVVYHDNRLIQELKINESY